MTLINCAILVATHLSSLAPSPQPVPVPTTQNEISDSYSEKSPPSTTLPEHASYATQFLTPLNTTLLLRVLHYGRILELVSLSSETPTLRFDFASPLLPHPAIADYNGNGLWIVALSSNGSLYRILVPLRDGIPSWPPPSHVQWCHEHVLQAVSHQGEGFSIAIQNASCAAISMPDGSLLRVERDMKDEDGRTVSPTYSFRVIYTWSLGRWRETKYSNRSLLNPLAYLLPAMKRPTEGDAVVSIACCPPPSDVANACTLSRDRTLRLWTPGGGCVVAIPLPAIASEKTLVRDATSLRPAILLPPEPQKLLHAWHGSRGDMYVLVFIPTESASTSGGFFQLYLNKETSMRLLYTFEASPESLHCHLQDFIVDGRMQTLHTVWDCQGQSMLHDITLIYDESSIEDQEWRITRYSPEPELTPAYIDELLLSSGSLAGKLFEAIMRPGMFSSLTLQTAVEQYTDAHRSLPPPYPPQILTTYASVGEQIAAVVGCTVRLTRDPRTGALQYSKYWSALKRDWEGFIARCREIERGARWPLAICLGGSDHGTIVVERERIALVATNDSALEYHRKLQDSEPLDPIAALLELIWTLRSRIDPRTMHILESRLVDIVHQEAAFPFADIIQDQAQRMEFKDKLDEGLEDWVTGRLQGIEDLNSCLRFVIDLIGGLDLEVKEENGDLDLSRMPSVPEWKQALTASYTSATVHVRYELCLSLMTLLFFLADELPLWNPNLLAEISAVFRGVAMLRYVVRQPAGDTITPSLDASASAGEDEVVSQMRNMQVSNGRSGIFPLHSLIHRLVVQYGIGTDPLPASAQKFLDVSGLLQSTSAARATQVEVQFCENLRLLGYREAAREMLAWLPRAPGVTYILGRLWLDEGRYDDAASALGSVAGSFGLQDVLIEDDEKALASILPGGQLFNSEFDYYLHAASLSKTVGAVSQEVFFTQRAVSVAPPDVDTTTLWHVIIRGLTDLGLYEDAYAALVSTPYNRLKRECISQLVYRMCEENAVERLMSFNFAGLADEVEDALSFKARNADPRIRPFYSRILYSWHVSRGDYRNGERSHLRSRSSQASQQGSIFTAALTMYQRARKLANLIGDPSNFTSLTELQLEAYVTSMNALALTDQKSAWIVLPVTAETEHEPRKRRKLSRHIPEDKYTVGKRDAEIVELADMQYEYSLLSARLELIRRDPTLLTGGVLLLSPSSIVSRLTQVNLFDMAMSTARSLDVDMTDLFGRLTTQCLRLSHNPDVVIAEDTSDWLLTDKVSSWPGTPVNRGWRYLRQSLERHDGAETDYKYSKIALETILGFDRSSPPPPWLIQSLEAQHPEYLIRTCLRYDNLEYALDHTLSFMRWSNERMVQEQPKTASATWLPYTLIDQVLLAADSQEGLTSREEILRKENYHRIVVPFVSIMSPFRKSFMKNWYAIEATPIFAVVGLAVVGCGWYLTRLARGPTVVWTKENPTPWNDVKQNENIKLLAVNHQFEKGWERRKL
ncbi:uncharacterized protein FIBRA_06187 [Fibroporia radiculosa]|uniref:Nuclear pore complex protein Nup160 n=1 Tax=Fibroporia radiculosa TaxID=599839 RepID=J4GSB3_9APHY|nr:uncharacterized protein FIBRA_06187 [Fibroporia radiculosa]CCM04030.1 predicted protein [Fibroporia radiculosa]